MRALQGWTESGADLAAFGDICDRSQLLSDIGLENIVAETRWLPAKARELGAAAASAFGAGFGGSVWALVERAKAPAFLDAWRAAYEAAFPDLRGEFFLTEACDGAKEIAPEG